MEGCLRPISSADTHLCKHYSAVESVLEAAAGASHALAHCNCDGSRRSLSTEPNRVQTISKAIVTCKSNDEDAYECATVTATAEAYAKATAKAHSEAVAAAVNSCGCMSDAVSESIASESVYIKLVAEAASTATATACIEGAQCTCAGRLI